MLPTPTSPLARRMLSAVRAASALAVLAFLLPACTPPGVAVEPASLTSATSADLLHSEADDDAEALAYELNVGGAGEALYYDLQVATLDHLGAVVTETNFIHPDAEGAEELRLESCRATADPELCLLLADVATSFAEAYELPLYATSATAVGHQELSFLAGPDGPCPPPEIDPGQPDRIRLDELAEWRPIGEVMPGAGLSKHTREDPGNEGSPFAHWKASAELGSGVVLTFDPEPDPDNPDPRCSVEEWL